VPRAKLRTPELRAQVLHAAMATLANDGVDRFTTRQVAKAAHTSTPAVYELFGDKAGLVREMFFLSFEELGDRFSELTESQDVRQDLFDVVDTLRRFVNENPALGQLMFSRPFADFDPGSRERSAGDNVRDFMVARVRRCVDKGIFNGNESDIAHVILALTRGLATQEAAGWLGTSSESIERRWRVALGALFAGLESHPN
jgi:AcrR family transcriptional regulator